MIYKNIYENIKTMSNWIIPKIKDIDFIEGKEIHIYIGSDDSGNNYVSIEGEALKYLLELLTPTIQGKE